MKYARSIESKLSEQHAFIQRKSDKSLNIVLPFNGIRTYSDGETLYSVLEYIEEHDYLVIHQQYWEGNAYALLNMKTGKFHEITGYPLFSPNGKYIAVVEKDLVAEYSPNTLQIYKAKHTLELVHDAKPKLWGPGKVKWKNNTSLSFLKTKYNDKHDPFSKSKELSARYIEVPATLELRDGVWDLTLNE